MKDLYDITPPWKPLLQGALCSEAMLCIERITLDLLSAQTVDWDSWDLCDSAVLFAYLAQTDNFPGNNPWETVSSTLNRAVEKTTSPFVVSGLFGGLAGIGWTLTHVNSLYERQFLEPPHKAPPYGEPDDSSDEIDNVLLRRLQDWGPNGEYDLISGLVGIGVYFLERWPRASAYHGLLLILDRLEDTAESTTCGITWVTSLEQTHPELRSRYPTGHVNLGVAHGIPAVIKFLSNLCALGIGGNRPERLLRSALDWLLEIAPAPRGASIFPTFYAKNGKFAESRLAWCYGDAGIAALLYGTGNIISSSSLKNEAIRLLEHILLRPEEGDGVVDAHLCHGALGIAHIFNRIFQAEGRPDFEEAAQRFYKRALTLRSETIGFGGFYKWSASGNHASDASLLSGSAGSALALLAACSSMSPDWDRLLLLSSPPTASPL